MTNLPGSYTRGKNFWWPLEELDSLFAESSKSFPKKSFEIDVIEQPEHYVIKANMPGVNRSNIDVTLEHNTLTITQKAEDNIEEKNEGFLHRERWSQTCSRSVRLPKASSSEDVKASLKDGVLEVSVAKAVEKLSRKIDIN
ncbi:MAG: Hsp20/alpha crystallin family protein [Bdellovibrionales bacterium]|nr:Hsp20/alpha crystallin family protein [Bdellovibrionales bacterium]